MDNKKFEIPKLSYENSKRLLGLSCHMQSAINDLIRNGYGQSIEKVTSDVNKAIFELAEKRKCSIYDICFHFMPVESEFRTERDPNDPLGQRYTISSEIQLVPIEFEFEQGAWVLEGKVFQTETEATRID